MYQPVPTYPWWNAGLGGSGQAAVQGIQIGASVGAPVISAAAAHSAALSIAAGGTGQILGMAPALAVPIIGAAIAGITILATALIKNSGCGQTCIITSQWANQAATLLDQNIAAYFSIPVPRSVSQQQAALANFDAIWARLVQMCSDPSTGNAGKRCISDRQAGACTWKQTADKVPPWGTPAAGECWNWFNGYRDPIANDTNVVPDSLLQTASNTAESVASTLGLTTALQSVGVSPSYAAPIVILVALALIGAFVL